ncbi:MAG TPA: choice-of-anchor D domain-containing protein [Candidatus Kapabacteria bacterium]|nr:choice-of-anchor D domain-containing protein [Candidatus Kapabacteria bacterium]
MKLPFVFRKFLVLIVLLLLAPVWLAPSTFAQQGQTSSGTDFWLGFMPNGAGAGNTGVYEDLFIASGTDNKVTIDITGNGARTLTMTAGQVYDYALSDYMTWKPDTATTNAIHVTSTNPITVYGYSAWANPEGIGDSPDGYLGLPLPAYGTEYYTMNFPDNSVFGNMPGEFLIISPYDNNTVTITPAAETKAGRPAGVPWNITLSKGQTYLVQSPGTNFGANDLTGSLIQSTKPVAVITGHQITSVPSDGPTSADNLLEMIPSVDKWGTQYFDMPMSGKLIAGDYLRVLSAQNGNQITYTGLSVQRNITLDSGQYEDIAQNTEPLILTSTNHKRFIVAMYSYSQGMYGDPGYSDPFLVLFTPREQFEKGVLFRTPTSLRGAFTNYVTFIGLKDSLSKIVINGQPIGAYSQVGTATFPGTNPVMGAQRILIAAQPKSYIATGPDPFDAYQYGFSNFEGYGWPAGMAQGILSTGDTLPPLSQTLNSSCGNYHLLFAEPRLKSNGFSFDDTRIASVSMITAAGDLRCPTPSYNYTFTPDSNFIPGDSVMTATLTVNNPAEDAYAAIDAVDLAGNDTVYQYHYSAPKISFSPSASYNFGPVLVDADSCQHVTITNVQSAGAFNAESDSIAGIAKGGTFTVTPQTLRPIPDSSSISLDICFHPADTGMVSIDSLYLISECATFVVPVTGTGVTPLIYATDLDFGEVDSGQTKCLPLTIRNPGKAPLTITSSDFVNDSNFSVDAGQLFPITIPPGASIHIECCFHPQSWGSFSQLVTFLNLNPTAFQHSIKDTSLLTGKSVKSGIRSSSANLPLSLSISPNPASGAATISLGAPSAKVEIFDVLGREVASFRVAGSYEWQMGALPAGTYIVRAAAGGMVVSKRVVKE